MQIGEEKLTTIERFRKLIGMIEGQIREEEAFEAQAAVNDPSLKGGA